MKLTRFSFIKSGSCPKRAPLFSRPDELYAVKKVLTTLAKKINMAKKDEGG